MPDFYRTDAAESGAPLPPETIMIVEARLPSSGLEPADARPVARARLAISAGVAVLVFMVAYIVFKLLAN